MSEKEEKIMSLTDFKQLGESNRWFALWEGIGSIWSKLEDLTIRVDIIEKKTNMHEKVLITGNAEENEPSALERLRLLERLALKIERISNAVVLQTIAFFFTMIGIGLTFFLKFYPLLVKLAEQKTP